MATQLFQPEPPYGSLAWIRDAIEAGKSEKRIVPLKITPLIAKQLLMLNTKNRTIKPNKLEQYRRSVRAGLWRGLNGETIKVKKDGSLGDGQHRLTVIAEDGVEIEMFVMFGATDEDILTIDQGSVRTAGDVDRMNGGEYSEIASAAARRMIAYEASAGTSIGLASRISNAEVLARLDTDNRLRDAAKWASSHKAPGLPASAIAFCWRILSAVHQEHADEYLMQVCQGVNLRLKDPAATVRDYLINRVNSGNKFGAKKIEAVLRGWNAFREERDFAKVVTNGTFPELV